MIDCHEHPLVGESLTAAGKTLWSGEGRKDDGGAGSTAPEKPRWDLLPWEAVAVVVDVLTYGARKYAPENWRRVPEGRARYFSAAQRHLTAWWGGEKLDGESGLHHLGHAGACILFLLALELR